MRSKKVIAPVAFVAAAAVVGLVSAMPTASSSASGSSPAFYDGPVAEATGGDVTTVLYPSIVNVRLVRTEAALVRAATLVDQGKGASAVAELKSAQANMSAAWTAAKYVIRTAPPPPPADGKAGAHVSGGAVAGASPYAAAEPTGLAVLSLQHDVITNSLGLLDTAPAALQTQIKTTVRAAISARDAAVAYIISIAPPPPPADGRPGAHVSGGAVATGWDTLMPTYVPILDDEIQQLNGMRSISPKLTPVLLKTARTSVTNTRNKINTTWPPPPAG